MHAYRSDSIRCLRSKYLDSAAPMTATSTRAAALMIAALTSGDIEAVSEALDAACCSAILTLSGVYLLLAKDS